IDLTTLSGDDTPGRVRRLCAKARQPIRPDMLEALGIDFPVTVGAVCVYPSRVREAVEALRGTSIPVASVATGFPAGQTPLPQRIAEIEQAIEAGAREVDVVINRTLALTGDWQTLYDELKRFRETCGHSVHMKTILATGDLGTLRQVYQASLVAMMAGSDFIKTSTGKESLNATLEFGLVMLRAIRAYLERTGYKVGFKPAGGINSAKQTLVWQALIKEELGADWLMPDLFRIGASSLLTDLERQLYHCITGHYAARHHMPMG
ncbi:MAG: deoxyribose-phosphate aldolase, partial [Anaerolineales bacterium]|nr:deoxyribose-phosphate aldolase [Anaerolineales bacterium]